MKTARPVVGAHAGLHELHADARARVDQEVRGAAERDQRGRAAPRGIGRWSTGAEKDRAHGATDATSGAVGGKVSAMLRTASRWLATLLLVSAGLVPAPPAPSPSRSTPTRRRPPRRDAATGGVPPRRLRDRLHLRLRQRPADVRSGGLRADGARRLPGDRAQRLGHRRRQPPRRRRRDLSSSGSSATTAGVSRRCTSWSPRAAAGASTAW